MERLLAIWIPTLSEEKPDGSTLREYLAVFDVLTVLCPFTEPVRLGLLTLPVRGPSRFFGGDEALLDTVRQSVLDVLGVTPMLGVAEGLFCAELAAHRELVIPAGSTESFRRTLSLDTLGRKDLAVTCRRLGLHNVGAFADLERARVAERFSKSVLELHRVARGELSELKEQRDPRLAKRLRIQRGDDELGDEQMGFFGQRAAGDDRAQAAAHRVRSRLGADAVVVASLRGGRVPEDRALLVPFGSPPGAALDDAPWPGQFRAPAPAMSLSHRVAVELRDEHDAPVSVEARGLLSAAPVSLLFTMRARRDVVWSAGPWPLVERWWVINRRRAHLQVVLVTGEALLLVAETDRWWVVGIYD